MRRADSRGSAVPPPPPPRLGHSTSTIGRSGSTDKLLRLKQRADRAAGKREAEEEVEAGFRSALLEIVFYLFFVLIFGLVTWLSATDAAYPYASKIANVVSGDPPLSFSDVYQESQFWAYLEDWFAEVVFVTEDDNGDALPESRLGYVLEVDKLIGAVRLEQRRVRLDRSACAVPPVYATLIDRCYPRIRSELDVSNEPYGPEDRFTPTAAGFFAGFGGQRFVQDIPNDSTAKEAAELIRGLRNASWVDRQTREVAVVFTVYNPAVDLFCNARLTFEFLHTGGIRTRSQFRTISMLRQWLLLTPSRLFFPPDLRHRLLFACEMAFLLIVLVMVGGEVRQLARLGWIAYISSVWNVIDVLNLSLFVVFFFYRFYFVALTALLDFRPEPHVFSEFRYMAELAYQSQNLTAFNCVLTYMKMFKYLQFSTRLSQLTHTLTEASEDLAGFLFMFLLVFMAYAFSFHMAFGMDVDDFQDFTNSFYTLFLIILGEFDFEQLRLANDLLGPVLFVSYVVIVYLILFNMFLAIIGEAYVRVKERTSAFEDPFIRNIRAGLNARKQRRLRKLEKALGGVEADQVVTAADVREIESELREILGDAEADAIMLKMAADDELGGGIPQDELASLMARIVESREKLEAEMRRQEAVDANRSLPEEIEARDPAFALRVSTARAARERIQQIERNQKNLFDSIQSSQKAVLLKVRSLTDTMEMISSKLSTLKTVQRRG